MDRRIRFALSLLFAAPATALAWESVDLIPYTTTGVFPAYPADDVRPFTAFAEFGVEYDSNPYRLDSSLNPTSDTVFRYGGGVRYNALVVGRQRVLLEARGDYYDYMKSDTLDNFAYSLLGEWQWEVGNSLSGAIGVGQVQRIANPADIQREVKQEVTTNRAYANGGWAFATNWRVRAGVEGDESTRKRDLAPAVTTNTTGVLAGLDYVTPLANTFGIEGRWSRGDAPANEAFDPTGQFSSNQFRQEEVAAVVSYGATSQFRVGGRVGHTNRTFTQIQGNDFSGTTWRALVEWLPGNKTILGFETYNFPESIIDVDASYVIRKGSAFMASWAPLAKLVFTGRIFEERRQVIGTPAALAAGIPTRDDTTQGYRLGVGWEPVRYCEVGVGVEQGNRTSNFPLRGFEFTTVTANVRIRF